MEILQKHFLPLKIYRMKNKSTHFILLNKKIYKMNLKMK